MAFLPEQVVEAIFKEKRASAPEARWWGGGSVFSKDGRNKKRRVSGGRKAHCPQHPLPHSGCRCQAAAPRSCVGAFPQILRN